MPTVAQPGWLKGLTRIQGRECSSGHVSPHPLCCFKRVPVVSLVGGHHPPEVRAGKKTDPTKLVFDLTTDGASVIRADGRVVAPHDLGVTGQVDEREDGVLP